MGVDASAGGHVRGKGLKPNAITFVSNVVIGVASAAPAYSLASALGTIAGLAAFGTPAILIAAFLPMFCVAVAYYHLNRALPDCGTTFSWVARTMGPSAGWIGGWALIATNIIVMPSLAAIAGQYTLQLLGESDPSLAAVTALGVGWIVLMTALCYFGIEISATTQRVLLAGEVIVLLLFAAVALFKVYTGRATAEATPVALSWFNMFSPEASSKFIEAMLVAVFIYWGWDSGLSINEETEDPERAPGRAAVMSTLLLLGVYLLVTVATLAYAGPELLAKNSADVFAPIGTAVLGTGLDKLLVLAVLTSASASTQTTILPAARTALSMAAAGALPKRFGEIHPTYLNPGFGTLVMGAVSIVWYVGLSMLSKNVLDDSVLALGVLISFYYALTAFACVIQHRRQLAASVLEFVSYGVLPTLGGLAMLALFVASLLSLGGTGSTKIGGIGSPLAIGIGALAVGGILMLVVRRWHPNFFERRAR